MLQPVDISSSYTLEEIETEITEIKLSISAARGAVVDKMDDTQAQIMVKRQTLKDLREELSIYIKAKNILNDTDSSKAELIAAQYNPNRPRI